MTTIAVQRLCVGDRVRFTPESEGEIDVVVKLHLRRHVGEPVEGSHMVTVTHERGCWSKGLGESVELVGSVLT